jgi:rare lipoprotein A
MPLPSYARVRNLSNAREVIVRINDRGPFHPGRVIDLSYTAAYKLDLLRGAGMVEVERITHDQIRDGSWTRQAAAPQPRMPAIASAAVGVPAPSPVLPATVARERLSEVPASATAVAVARVDPIPPAAQPLAPAALPLAPAALPLTPPAQPIVPVPAADSAYWVQLGAFRQRDGASAFRQRVGADLGWLAPALAVFDDAGLHRLQAGPYPDLDQATQVAQRVREQLQLVPIVVERR